MLRVLMCGPLNLSEGVSIHTKYISQFLSAYDLKLILYNLTGKNINSVDSNPVRKLYQRTIGLIFYATKIRNKFDIIHVQVSGGFFSFITAISGSLVSVLFNKKYVVTFHYRPSKEIFLKYNSLFNFILRQSDVFFVVSNRQKKIIDDLYPEYSEKVLVTSNGFDGNLFKLISQEACRNSLNIGISKKVIVSVGNFYRVKGHEYLINAISAISKSEKNVVCFLIGSGHLESEIKRQVSDLHLENYVHLIGKVPHNKIPIWLNASDIFVLSSLEEGNPTVMFEALGCGRPFIGTSVGGIPEIIKSNEYGLLCEPGNSKKLENIMKVALDTNWDIQKIKKYSNEFDWRNVSQKLYEVYGKLVCP